MPDNVERFVYQGPNTEWKPQIGGLDKTLDRKLNAQTDTGYHDLAYLLRLLDQLIADSGNMYAECENQLSDYALVIDTNDQDLVNAHTQAYPDDDTPGSITFDEYKYLLEHNNSNAAHFVILAYEMKVRGSAGTNALDISLLSLYINSECKRIKEFINAYIGEIDDTSEFRTIEVFQDWAEDAQSIISELWAALKGEIQRSIPQPELDNVTETKAGQFQATFQYKLNVINKQVVSQFNDLSKKWDGPSTTFYNKNLGPALKFRLKVGRSIGEGVDSTSFPILSAEASGTTIGSDANFEVALADCIKRNNMFFDLIVRIMTNIAQRDSYVKYMGQLSNKGKPVATPFVKSDSINQAAPITEARILDADRSVNNGSNTFYNAHADLNGLTDDDAHTQYVLRTGNSDKPITGDISVEDGITIDGVDISEHTHDGINSRKIHGSNLEFGTVSSEVLDLSTTATSTPSNLTIESIQASFLSPGNSKMEAVVSFDVDLTGITGYEFEIIKLD